LKDLKRKKKGLKEKCAIKRGKLKRGTYEAGGPSNAHLGAGTQ